MKNLNRFLDTAQKKVASSVINLILVCIVLASSFTSTAQTVVLDDPNALEGQIIVDPLNSAWFKYNGGKHVFICGAGDPENFLYRGDRLADGTRDGDQLELIEKMAGTGANSIHVISFRSKKYGGDGADDHNPFVDSDISKALDENILDQWETWFTEMDKNGIVIYFFIYDDEINLKDKVNWKMNESGQLHQQEHYFITSLVEKFKHHKNLIWVVMEGASKIHGHEEHLKKVAALVKETDNHNHPIGISENNKLDFYEYANDGNIDLFSLIYYSTNTPRKIHDMILEAKYIARDRYSICFTESLKYGTGAEMRQKNWAAAMAGAYVMVYQMDILNTELSDMQDCGRLRTFFESTEFFNMKSNDGLAIGDTEYVLATTLNIGSPSYIAYSSKTNKGLGIKGLSEGSYEIVWLDCINGETLSNKIQVNEGDNTWEKPKSMGSEIALSVKKVSN